LWEGPWIYKYNVKSQTKVLEILAEFSINGENKGTRSGDGSGREIAYGNNEIYLWWNYHEIAVFDTNTGSFKRYFRTDKGNRIATSKTGDGRWCQKSASMTYKSNSLYLIGSYESTNDMYFAQISKNGRRVTNFKPRVCNGEGRCSELQNTCGDSHAIGKNYFYLWNNDEVYVYKMPFPSTSGYNISDDVFKNKVHVPCTSEYIPAGSCGGGGDITKRTLSFRSQQGGVGTRGAWSTNMVFVPSQINSPYINIQMQISLEKNYINKKIEETFYSSATVRNF